MIAAHVRATSVDVLKAPVYWWRRRIDSDASITQRRFEIGNLRDRMDAIDRRSSCCTVRGRSSGSHDRKVLTFDVPLYTPYYPRLTPQYQRLFRTGGGLRPGDDPGRSGRTRTSRPTALLADRAGPP